MVGQVEWQGGWQGAGRKATASMAVGQRQSMRFGWQVGRRPDMHGQLQASCRHRPYTHLCGLFLPLAGGPSASRSASNCSTCTKAVGGRAGAGHSTFCRAAAPLRGRLPSRCIGPVQSQPPAPLACVSSCATVSDSQSAHLSLATSICSGIG